MKPENNVRFFHTAPGRILLSTLIVLLAGSVYFYVSLPAINLQDSSFYRFVLFLCLVYVASIFFLSGRPFEKIPGAPLENLKAWLRFIFRRCLPAGVLLLALAVIAVIGSLVSLPLFRAGDYRELLSVVEGNFSQDVAQISFSEIPTLDRTSAEYLGDRQMGTLGDMVSQFEYANDSTQINYQNRPVRVSPIDYADLFKWLTNRKSGLPAYVVVDMVSQEATVQRLSEGMKYSFSEPLGRNILRHLRFSYPTFMFTNPEFEIDEEGQPWWIAPRLVKRIGLFGGVDIQGAVLVNAITGESTYYEEVPTWVDTLYQPWLIMEQYNYHGTLVHGFINSILGQRDVTMATQGYNYIAMNDDVYVYTGVTSANSDQSNLGFLLCNMRTKETRFYSAPGATENAAMRSAMGVVQDLGYQATFPLLLNIAGQPTYFIPLKDATELVKMYAMVNVAQYQVVATGTTVVDCEASYIRMLSGKGITEPAQRSETQTQGKIEEIRSAVLDGTTYYFIRLAGDPIFYALSAAEDRSVVTLNPGDEIQIDHAPPAEGIDASVLDGYRFTLLQAASARTPAPATPAAPTEPVGPAEPAEPAA